MKTREQNRNNSRTEIGRFDWFIEWRQTRVPFGWLSERSDEKDSPAAGLAQLVERLTAKRKVAGSIPGARPILGVLKYLGNEGTPFALQAASPSGGLDDHVKWRPVSSWGRKHSVPNKYFRAKYLDTQIKCIFLCPRTFQKSIDTSL